MSEASRRRSAERKELMQAVAIRYDKELYATERIMRERRAKRLAMRQAAENIKQEKREKMKLAQENRVHNVVIPRDLEVVSTKQLGDAIDMFIAETDEMSIQTYGNEQYGAVHWLSDESGINARDIYEIRSGGTRWVGIGKADKLLTAMGYMHMLHNGSINVVPNPLMSRELWANRMAERCCDAESPYDCL